ncbi:phage major capsid protein [Dokdonella immobilis]|uniref:Phage major capsid protein, HK97 family n=1 Tax=Dokdonella immobilis TaxID=578942 RepID=A0A1I4ZV02_9GAMM|nr:phage major capsid protein [Dokdonella immobilis]SFN53829.1 phage major capsid protein, HK97 family [Dokdonella immobilis]
MAYDTAALKASRTFVRSLIARSVTKGSAEATTAYAHSRWPWAGPESISKGAVSSLTSDGNKFAADFLGAVLGRTVLSRLGFRQVPFNVRLISQTTGAQGYWVSQASPKPLSKPALVGSTLAPLKCAALICQTQEALRDTSNLVEAGLSADLERAVAAAVDLAFLDPANAGIAGETPASITYAAPSTPATGLTFDALRSDLSTLLSMYGGDIETAALIMAPVSALQIALLAGASSQVDLSASGGTMFGLPVATTSALALDSNGPTIALVDTQAIAYGLEDLDIQTADQTSLTMSDDPESDPGELVSLWQTNTTAWMAEALANWEVQRSGAVVMLTGVHYA